MYYRRLLLSKQSDCSFTAWVKQEQKRRAPPVEVPGIAPSSVVKPPIHYRTYSALDLRGAHNAVVNRSQSKRSSAAQFGVPRSTLYDAIKRGHVADKLGRPTLMTEEQERRLARYMIDRANACLGATRSEAGSIASEILGTNGAYFATEDGLPSSGWWASFTKRHPGVSFYKPCRLAKNKLQALTVETVTELFQRLDGILKTYDLPESKIFNCDESQIRTRLEEKVLGPKGCRRVRALDVKEHSHVSFLPFISADGSMLPCPIFIFKGKRSSMELAGDAFPEAAVIVTGTRVFVVLFSLNNCT